MNTRSTPGAGRFAPSPSGELHFGNLRTALLAWLISRTQGHAFYLRIEDLDPQRSRPEYADAQMRDLEALGLDWDDPVIRQSDRLDIYRDIIASLPTYRCICTRNDLREAARAPHGTPGIYPGTCRTRALPDTVRSSLRLRSDAPTYRITDIIHGPYEGSVDDFILCRSDHVPAYNLAVVVDDADQGISHVVRGVDLLSSAPRQAYLAHLLGYPRITYAHVPLVLNRDGVRLSKRDGAVTFQALEAMHGRGWTIRALAHSLGIPDATSAQEIAERFTLDGFIASPFAHDSYTYDHDYPKI